MALVDVFNLSIATTKYGNTLEHGATWWWGWLLPDSGGWSKQLGERGEGGGNEVVTSSDNIKGEMTAKMGKASDNNNNKNGDHNNRNGDASRRGLYK